MLNNAPARQWLSRVAGLKPATCPAKPPPSPISAASWSRSAPRCWSTRDGGRLHDDWLASLADDIAGLHGDKRDVLVVSSGAIALGRAVLKLPPGPLKLED